MVRNITKEFKDAIAVNEPWSFSDFYYFIEILEKNSFGVSHWKGEEDWAQISDGNDLIAYIWVKYPLIFVKSDHFDEISFFTNELRYIILVESHDLNSIEFTIDMDQGLLDRISFLIGKNNFSANDMWFHNYN